MSTLKTVTSLPQDIVAEGQFFVLMYKKGMIGFVVPAFVYFLLPSVVSTLAIVILALFYYHVFFRSDISRMLWRHDLVLWCQLFISLFFALCVVIFLRYFDLNHWLIHEVGYIPDGNVTPFWAAASFIPLGAAYFDSPFKDKSIDLSKWMYTGGIGIRGKSMFFDVAYAQTQYDDQFYVNTDNTIWQGLYFDDAIKLSNRRHQVSFTLGFKF